MGKFECHLWLWLTWHSNKMKFPAQMRLPFSSPSAFSPEMFWSFLGFSIEGPSQAKISCKDNGDGSAEVSYLPTAPGEYAIHILCNEEDIPDSPFMVEIQPYQEGVQPSQVRRWSVSCIQFNLLLAIGCFYRSVVWVQVWRNEELCGANELILLLILKMLVSHH